MISKMNASTIIRLAEEVAVLAGEECSDAIRIALEERKTRMLRAPNRSRVLTQEEIKELLSYAPIP
jgi:hypothetical protein